MRQVLIDLMYRIPCLIAAVPKRQAKRCKWRLLAKQCHVAAVLGEPVHCCEMRPSGVAGAKLLLVIGDMPGKQFRVQWIGYAHDSNHDIFRIDISN